MVPSKGLLRPMNRRTPCKWEYTPCHGSLRGLLPSKKYQSPCKREVTPGEDSLRGVLPSMNHSPTMEVHTLLSFVEGYNPFNEKLELL